jgi:hypothetical protein
MTELLGLSYEHLVKRFDWTNLYGENSAASGAGEVEDRRRGRILKDSLSERYEPN